MTSSKYPNIPGSSYHTHHPVRFIKNSDYPPDHVQADRVMTSLSVAGSMIDEPPHCSLSARKASYRRFGRVIG